MYTDNHCQNYQLFQKRRNARSTIVQSVYIHLLMDASLLGSLNDVKSISPHEMKRDDTLVDLVLNYLRENFDAVLSALQQQLHYDLSRFSLMDRSILLVALAEMKAAPFTEKSIIIDEYIEITKKFSDISSKGKINAILDALSQHENKIFDNNSQVSEQYCDS